MPGDHPNFYAPIGASLPALRASGPTLRGETFHELQPLTPPNPHIFQQPTLLLCPLPGNSPLLIFPPTPPPQAHQPWVSSPPPPPPPQPPNRPPTAPSSPRTAARATAATRPATPSSPAWTAPTSSTASRNRTPRGGNAGAWRRGWGGSVRRVGWVVFFCFCFGKMPEGGLMRGGWCGMGSWFGG